MVTPQQLAQRDVEKFKQREKSNIKERTILRKTKENIKKERIERFKKPFRQLDTAQREFGQSSKKFDRVARRTFKKVAGAVRYKKQLSTNLLKQFSGGSQSQGTKNVGRPKGSLKWKDPRTGQPVPATIYYKIIRDLNRQAKNQAQYSQIQQVQQLAKRGIPPQVAQQVVQQRVNPIQQMQQVPQVQQNVPMQQQLTPEQIRILQLQRGTAPRQIWRRQPKIGQEGGVTKVYGVPQSFWN